MGVMAEWRIRHLPVAEQGYVLGVISSTDLLKLAIQQKGGVGIRSLKNIFRRMDFNGNKALDIGEFEQALAAFGYVSIYLSLILFA